MRVVAEVGSGQEALEAIRREQPEVALVDYQLPDIDGVGCCACRGSRRAGYARCAAVGPHRQFAGLSSSEGGSRRVPVQGRSAFGHRRERAKAARGQVVVPTELAAGLAGEIRVRAQSSVPALSDRERQVLQGFARGLSVPQVAQELFIGVSHGQDPHPAAVREAGGVRPGGGGGRSNAPGPAGVGSGGLPRTGEPAGRSPGNLVRSCECGEAARLLARACSASTRVPLTSLSRLANQRSLVGGLTLASPGVESQLVS